MKAVLFPLKPMAHFHFGEISVDEKMDISTTSAYPHSDTLFSALINSFAQNHTVIQNEELISDFKSGKTIISSMFYYLNIREQFIFFLPKPLSISSKIVDSMFYKQLRKIDFISEQVWLTIKDANDFFDPGKCFIIQNKFVVLASEVDADIVDEINIYNETTQPKVPIRWNDKDASIYFETDIEIGVNSNIPDLIEVGYYFLYSSNNPKPLIEAIEMMALTGIGGGRSTGTGQLGSPNFEDNVLNSLESIDAKNFCSISLSVPADGPDFELFDLYETKIRGGRKMEIGKQNFIRMIKEGAILKGKARGKLVELGHDERNNIVYRNGKCFLIPVYSL